MFRHVEHDRPAAKLESPTKSSTFSLPRHAERFGNVGALSLGMMPQLIDAPEHGHGPHCTREQARELLESLRIAYQSLSFAERSLVKTFIAQKQRVQLMLEAD